MTEQTGRVSALLMALMMATAMTCLSGCGGCSSEPEGGQEESAQSQQESAEGDSKTTAEAAKSASERPSADAKVTAGVDAAKPVPGLRGAKAPAAEKPKRSGALDADAKRLANRKAMEADLKKRANRRRAGEQAEEPKATNARPPAAAPAAAASARTENPLARAVPEVIKGKPEAARAKAPAGKVLNIGRYMTITQARKITGDATLSKGRPLTGIEPSATYNVSYFAPQLRSKFGVSVQVWKEKIRRDANERFRKMKRDFPNAEETKAVPPSAIFSHFQGIMTLSFTDLTKSIVVSVSCGDTVCSDQELVDLANAVKKRL